MTTTLKDVEEGKHTDGQPPPGQPEPEVKSEPELLHLTAGRARDPGEYLVFEPQREPSKREEYEKGADIFETWHLIARVTCSGAEQAVRRVSKEFGAGPYAAVALSSFHRHETVADSVIQLRFVK